MKQHPLLMKYIITALVTLAGFGCDQRARSTDIYIPGQYIGWVVIIYTGGPNQKADHELISVGDSGVVWVKQGLRYGECKINYYDIDSDKKTRQIYSNHTTPNSNRSIYSEGTGVLEENGKKLHFLSLFVGSDTNWDSAQSKGDFIYRALEKGPE